MREKQKLPPLIDCIFTFKCFQVREFFFKGTIWFQGHRFLCLKLSTYRCKKNAGKGSFSDFFCGNKLFLVSCKRSFLIRLWNEDLIIFLRGVCTLSSTVRLSAFFSKCSLLFLNYLLFKVGILLYWPPWLQWSMLSNGCLF